jgi:hypothetical protein
MILCSCVRFLAPVLEPYRASRLLVQRCISNSCALAMARSILRATSLLNPATPRAEYRAPFITTNRGLLFTLV